MPGAEYRAEQPRQFGRPNFQQLEPGGIAKPGSGERRGNGQLGNPEIHYGGTPIVTVRLVNGVLQDIPHLYVDSRGGETRWWVERESIESWQTRVQSAKESGDNRFTDISPVRLPSSVVHTYPEIPASVLEKQPAYRDREWITLSYSLTPSQEGEIEVHTFLNTPPVPEDQTTSFRRILRVEEVSTLVSPESNSD
jgi:hypothetical protein